MNAGAEDFRTIIASGSLPLPYVIETRGGESYTITDHADARITEGAPDTVAICVRGKGIVMLALDAIDSIRLPHEVVMGS